MIMILMFLHALFLSTLVIPLLMRRAAAWHLLDVPDQRKIHTGSIPRIGGIAIATSVLASCLLWSLSNDGAASFLVGAVVIVVFGFMDDRSNLDYRLKFVGQIVGAAASFLLGVQVQHLPFFDLNSLPLLVSLPITIVLLLGATNAFNLLDGLDGLAAGCASLSLAAIATLSLIIGAELHIAVICAATLGGILGFLRYNTHPAIVYMGDAGSQFLGFIIGILAIVLVEGSNGGLRPALILPLLGLPVIDTAMVTLLRIKDGRSPFSPDRNHIHHKLLSVGMPHPLAVAVIYVVQATIVSSAVVLRHQTDTVIIGVYCAICFLCLVGYIVAKFRTRRLKATGTTKSASRSPVLWHDRARSLSIRYVECSVILYLIAGAILVDAVPIDVSATALAFAGITVGLGLWRRSAVPAIRLGVYLAAIYVSYLGGISVESRWLSSLPFYFWLASVALAVCSAMLLTPRGRFRLTTQDLLVALIVVGILTLPASTIDKALVSSVAIRALIFIYACELLIALRTATVPAIGLVATLSLLMIGLLHASPFGWNAVRSLWSALA